VFFQIGFHLGGPALAGRIEQIAVRGRVSGVANWRLTGIRRGELDVFCNPDEKFSYGTPSDPNAMIAAGTRLERYFAGFTWAPTR
jgi:hypothetical protein